MIRILEAIRIKITVTKKAKRFRFSLTMRTTWEYGMTAEIYQVVPLKFMREKADISSRSGRMPPEQER